MNKKSIFYVIFSLIFLAFPILKAKIHIYTYGYNRPDFIELQYNTLRKFLKEEFNFIVFNDAIDPQKFSAIQQVCKTNKLPCIKIPQEIHSKPYLKRIPPYQKWNHPTVRNCNVVQWSLDNFGFKHDDILLLMDSDLFLIKDWDPRDLLANYDLITWLKPCTENHKGDCTKAHPQVSKLEYCWIGLIALDMKKLPNKTTFNVNCGNIGKVAVSAGGFTYNYIQENPNLKILSLNRFCLDTFRCEKCNVKDFDCCHLEEQLIDKSFDRTLINFIKSFPFTQKRNPELFDNNRFLHYRAGTNYFHESANYIDKKNKAFFEFMNLILQE